MMNRTIQLILVSAAVATMSPVVQAQTSAAQESQQGEDASKHARALVREGASFIKLGNYEVARGKLLEAWRVRPAYDVAMLLAQAEMKLKLYRDAAEHLDYAIANFATVESDKLLETLQQALSEAKTHVGQLTVTTNREGAEVLVDGRLIGKAPLKNLVYVDPGAHNIEAREGTEVATQSVELDAGSALSAAVDFAPAPANANANASPGSSGTVALTPQPGAPPDVPAEQSRNLVAVVVGGAVAAAGVVTAVAFHLAANSEYDKLKGYSQAHGSSGCLDGSVAQSTCSAQHDSGARLERDRNLTTAGLVVAGVAVVATAAYWFWPTSEAQGARGDRGSLRLSASIAPQGSGLWLTGGF